MSKNNSETLWQKILKKFRTKKENNNTIENKEANNTEKSNINPIDAKEHKESNLQNAMRQLAAPYKETPQYQEYKRLLGKGYNVKNDPRFRYIQKYEDAPLVRKTSDKEDRDR